MLSKYDCLNLVFPHDLFYASQIIDGFKTFCETNRLKFSIIQQLTAESLKKNQAYIITRDQDLVTCINICNANNFILGRDIGLIAYNEDPIKEIIADGITTISTNHEQIGTEAARQILGKEFKEVKIPFSLIIRKSL